MGQCFRIGSGNCRMPTGILRKWGRLQEWLPVGINVFINYCFRPHVIAPVFFIPALNECIELRNSCKCKGVHRIGKIISCPFSRYAHNTHPVPGRRKLLCAEHDMPAYIQLERIVVPEFGDMLLFIGKTVHGILDLHYFLVVFTFFIGNIKCRRSRRHEL